MSLIRIGRGGVAHILYIRQNVHTVNDQWMKYSAVNSQSPAQSMVKLLKTSHLLQLWLAYGNDCQEGNVSVALVGQNSHHRIPTPSVRLQLLLQFNVLPPPPTTLYNGQDLSRFFTD